MDSTPTASPASSRPIPRTKYGKSCINCSKAKCKCTYPPGRSNCERCDRLNKQCRPLVSARKGERPDAPLNTPASVSTDDDSINERLDELIALLKARREASGALTNHGLDFAAAMPDNSSDQTAEDLPMHLRLDPTSLSEMTDNATAATTFSDEPKTGRIHMYKQIPVIRLPVSPEQATRCFNQFRSLMLPWLPFMFVSESMTVAELEKQWPTLHLCIMVIAATSTSQLFTWSEQFRQIVVRKMFESGERSLDILLAIIAFIGWLRHHRQERPFFNLWLNMAITLVSDLGLDRRAQTDNTWWPWHRDSVGIEQSTAEKRAVLAVFVISSISASSIKSVESLQWTPHMDTCLETLDTSPECEGDTVLAIQARCCLITEVLNRSSQSSWPYFASMIPENPGTTGGVSPDVIAAMEVQMEHLKGKVIEKKLEQNTIITMCLVTTELDIHEAVANPEQPYNDSNCLSSDKLARYHSQLVCLRRWWEVFLGIKPEDFPTVSFSVMTQLIHCVVSLFRLTILQHPGWDLQSVRNTANITENLSIFAAIVERAHQQVGLVCDRGDDLLIKTAKTMTKLRQYFLNMLVVMDAAVTGSQQLPLEFGENIPDMMDLDFWGSQWLTDMIISWEK